jgi:hypothetical protein
LGTLISAGTSSDWKELARAFSRFPLFVTLLVGIYSALAGSFKRGTIYRIGLLLNYLMILFAGYYHFWSVYENVSRMFAISVPLMIMLAKEDGEIKRLLYLIMLKFTFLLFMIKIIFIQKAQDYFIWTL